MVVAQVGALLLPGLSSLQTTFPMEIQPTYYPDNQQWLVEIDGKSFAADTLRFLKRQLPGVQIRDYHPAGYVATRDGFLQPSDRKPLVTVSSKKQRKIEKLREQAQALAEELKQATLAEAVGEKEAALLGSAQPATPEPAVTYEAVMELAGEGMRSPAIARTLKCKLSEVQLIRMEAYRRKDPRTRMLPKRFMRPLGPARLYTKEEDKQLATLAAQGLRSWEIGKRLNRSANSIIGRAQRKGIPLLWDRHQGGPKPEVVSHDQLVKTLA